jgi:hypothetical protein
MIDVGTGAGGAGMVLAVVRLEWQVRSCVGEEGEGGEMEGCRQCRAGEARQARERALQNHQGGA